MTRSNAVNRMCTRELASNPALVMFMPPRTSSFLYQSLNRFGIVEEESTTLYSSSTIPNLFSDWYKKELVRGGMNITRAGLLANSRVHILFTALLLVIAVVLLLRVKDY